MRFRTPDWVEWAVVLVGIPACLLRLIVRDWMSNRLPPDGYGEEVLSLLALVVAIMWALAVLWQASDGFGLI